MNDLIFPPHLQPGDKVVIISPSGKIDKSLLKGMKKRLDSWGLDAQISKHAGSSWGKYAGTISQRADDLQAAMDDPEVKAIFCSRGGYGAVHLVGKLDFTAFAQHPKWLIGYSDITLLHSLFQANGFSSIHGLMGRHLALEPEDDPCTVYLHNMLFGQLPEYACKAHKLNKKGHVQGILRGGNMAVLYGMRGTPYDFPAQDTILFVEDISERPHSVERMLYNLKLGGVLDKLSGLIIGQFTEYVEDKSLGKELYYALADVLKDHDFPICFNFPVGHVVNNVPLICGSAIDLQIDKKGTRLTFLPES